MNTIPEITVDAAESTCFDAARAGFDDLAGLEAGILGGASPGRAQTALTGLRHRILDAWTRCDHVVVRGLANRDDGSTALLVANLVFRELKSYRGAKLVKHFRMSPWTTALSHTTASGFFHTDLNTADVPPAATIMQCVQPDPGAPEFGQLRVARLGDLLAQLRTSGHAHALRLIGVDRVTMVNETSPEGWSGTIQSKDGIRFHPECLRAAQKRFGSNPPDMEVCLQAVQEAALAVSVPIDLAPGDVLVVSNRRALHQRGACTVRFRQYPRDFESRRVAVLHAMDEPA